MRKEVIKKSLIVFGIFLFFMVAIMLFDDGVNLTGNVVFGDDLSGGIYNGTEWNGSSIVLSGSNLSGDYVSEVYDVGAEAVWNNMSVVFTNSSVEYLYGVDGGGDVYRSVDNGVNWSLAKENYGRGSNTQGMFSDGTYLYIVVGGAREVWRSLDGENWVVINDSFNRDLEEGEADSSGKLYVVGGDGTVWQSIDFGVSWNVKGDFNAGASNDAKGSCMDSNDNFYVTDGSKGVFVSFNEGVNWTEQVNDYGGGDPDDIACFGDDLYIVRDKDVWKSNDSGVSWVEVNGDAFNDNSLRMDVFDGVLYVLDTKGRVYNSSDGIVWSEMGDMNPGDNNPKGLTDFVLYTNLSFQVKSCDDSACSGEAWIDVSDFLSLGVVDNRYFQYRAVFISFESGYSSILNSVSFDYGLVNSAPVVSVVSPQDFATYGYNESLNLNFFVTDGEGNLDSCWYNIDNGTNVSLAGCSNVTFDVVGDGGYNLNLFANDSLGLLSVDSVSFDVLVGAPTILMGDPNGVYLDGSDVVFNYTPTDIDLEACELWGNFSGVFEKNQTDVVPTSGVVNNFNLSLEDGEYFWNIWCNDTFDNFAFNGNKTFFVDTVYPIVSIVEPVGAKDSRDVALSFSAIDANVDSCWYNVYRGESLELDNTSVDCNTSTSFSVTVDADFVVNLYVNDSAGHLNVSNSTFSVDSSGGGDGGGGSSGGSGGSGGGGGGGSSGYVGVNLEIDSLKGVLIPGEEKILVVSVKNNGFKAVNKCRLKGSDGVSSNDIKNIASGEIVDFGFVLNVVDSVPNFWVECLEGRENISVELVLYVANMSAEISKINLGEGEIVVNYVVSSENGFDDVLTFRVSDSEENLVSSIDEEVVIGVGESFNGSIIIELSGDVNGLLNVGILSGEEILIEDTILYGDLAVGTGLVSLTGFDGDFTYGSLIILIFIIIAILIFIRIIKNVRGKGLGKVKKRDKRVGRVGKVWVKRRLGKR